jgi:hypothetical protein
VLSVELLETRTVPAAIPLFEMTDPTFLPAIPVANDSAANELGVEFTVFQPGTVSAIQFYRGATSASGFDVHLWDTNGNVLGSGHEDGNQAAGWQVVNLDQPVHLNQFQSYIASYFAPNGGYADTFDFFSNHEVDRGPLVAQADGQTGGEVVMVTHNGFYHYGGGFPAQTYRASNYWVGPIFQPDPDATNDPAPVITSLSQTTASTAGGGRLTIHGTNLLLGVGHPLPNVYIGGQQAAIPSGVLDPTALTVNIPAHLAGTVDVRVITDAGESDLTMADQLTYVQTTAIPLFESGDPTFIPNIPVANDSAPNELGVQFTVGVPGTVSAIQFYRGAASDAIFMVHLWDSNGNLLGTGQLSENQAGWQTVALNTSVHLDPNVTYIASYFTPIGGYADNYDFFTGTVWSRGPLAAIEGVYQYGGGFPSASYRDSNYWVGPVFTPDTGNAPTVMGLSQSATDTGGGDVITITGSHFFSGHVSVFFGDTPSINFTIQNDNTIAALVPPHPAGTVDVRVITDAGESDVTVADQLTYVASALSPNAIPLFETGDETFAPAIPVADDNAAQELGVKFTVGVPGTVNAIQFYRGAPSTSPFTVHLWDSNGNILGTGHVAGNQAAGWQTVLLDQPVHLDANVTYIASYYTPIGGYADNYNFFTGNAWSRGPLAAFEGVFRYGLGGGFPSDSYQDSNYWVGSVFTPDTGAVPTITGLSQSSSPTSGGAVLTITGSNFFSGHVSVYFGDTPSLNFTVVNANTLTVLIPPHPAGTIDVRVITDAGESAVTAADLFTYTL